MKKLNAVFLSSLLGCSFTRREILNSEINDPDVRLMAAYVDMRAGRDLDWMRKDRDISIRKLIALDDVANGRSREWMKLDVHPDIRWLAEVN